MLAVIRSRRSVRSYKNQSVPKEKLDKIIQMLPFIPTGANIDTLHFSIVGTKEKMDEIRKLTVEKLNALQSDDPMIQMIKGGMAYGDMLYRGAPSMIVVSVNKDICATGCETVDPIIALSYIELYAHTLGLGTLWDDVGVFMANMFPEVHDMLKIPEGYTLSFVLLLGEPSLKYKRSVQPDDVNVTIL